MWGNSEEPPGTMEAGPPDSMANLKETCEQSKNQLEAVKDTILQKKQSLKKKEEELQEYAKKLSKFKNRKAICPIKDDAMSSNESTPKSKSGTSAVETFEDVVDDISQAKTPKAKSSLLQKKLAEDRKIFEQKTRELIESKRAAEEKVEALRQQLEEKYVSPVSVVTPVIITSQTALPVLELSHVQDKDNKIAELNNKLLEYEAMIIDLQENLKEKDSVIDSKTKAITLMSADLSKKGKTTLDTLEETKDEMRSMQENFVLVETSLRSKNDNLLKQLEDKTEQIAKLEENVQSLTNNLEAQKQAESISADFSRSTMDTLAETKDAMKSMQENFILIESSLKAKNEHLLKQLEEREIKLAETEARILNLESGIGIERQPNVEDMLYKIDRLENMNHELQDEKYKLQKSIAELQEKILASQNINVDNSLIEKDNRIIELEASIEELKQSSQLSKENLEADIQTINIKNTEVSNKVEELEKLVEDLKSEKAELTTKITAIETENPKEDKKVEKLTKELDELNKSMIKLKAQHKNKLKTLQKQLKNFEKISDTNAELVRLGNQVAILEEEKGNLQLSLVDFDELKASTGEMKERINDLEGKVSTQAKEIQAHIEAIAILENQKLDLMQELHAVKQEISSLEVENAESENLRVTAEMKVVDLEEELESLNKLHSESLTDNERSELQRQIESLTQENERMLQKINKLEEMKSSSEVGSTESFVKTGSNVDSTESFEALAADADKADLLKKIDGLTRENGVLLEKLNRFEEKGSSDTGSTESFERIQPEHSDQTAKLENLTRENYELVVRVTKLEEKANVDESRLQLFTEENDRLVEEVTQLQEKLVQAEEVREKRSIEVTDESVTQQQTEDTPASTEVKETVNIEEFVIKIESLTMLNENLTTKLHELEHALEESTVEDKRGEFNNTEELMATIESLKTENENISSKLRELEQLEEKSVVIKKLHNESIDIEELKVKIEHLTAQNEELTIKLQQAEESNGEPIIVAQITPDIESVPAAIQQDLPNSEIVVSLESEIERCNALIENQKNVIEDMKTKLSEKEEELERKSTELFSENDTMNSLRKELQESASVIAEWERKCTDMEEKMQQLESSKQYIEEGFKVLQNENKHLIEESEQKDVLVSSLKEELDDTINNFETKMREQSETMASQEERINELRKGIEYKEQELHAKYKQAQNDLIKIDELQEHVNKLESQIQQRDATIASLTEEVEALRTNASVVEEDLFSARHQLTDLQDKLKNSKNIEEYNEVVAKLNDKEILVEDLEVKVSQKVTEINNLKSQVESLITENEQLQGQLQEEEHKVSELMSNLMEGNRHQEEELRNVERIKAEVENRLMELQITHEQSVQYTNNITQELHEAYKSLELLKAKHTEDIEMTNQRLENVIEELQAKSQELISLQSELEGKNSMIEKCIPEEVKSSLEVQVAELEKKLSEAEEKLQAQLEKMKKYAAVAKKKTAQVEDLENKLKEIEENLNLEKSEKESRNRELQESQTRIQEKDNKITEMEHELKHLRVERDEALQNVETVKYNLTEAEYLLHSFNEEIKILSEAKESARELGVRMQVMEAEYMDQMAQINSLRTENGLLISKQTQINERLENVEKESEERQAKLEKLEKEIEIAEMQRQEEVRRQEEAQTTCSQCTVRVQQLEAKLHERDAEIENLDNELHNSIGNLVQMQESLRLSTLNATQDSSVQESYNQLLAEYNVLTTANEEAKAKYEATVRENEELMERITRLQELNATMHERIESVEQELTKDKEMAKSYEEVNSLYTELLEKFEKQKVELEESQAKLHQVIAAQEASQNELIANVQALKEEKQILIQEYENLKSVKENSVMNEARSFEVTSPVVDFEAQISLAPVTENTEREKREVDETIIQKEEIPPLFDASVFGGPTLQIDNVDQNLEVERLNQEVSVLNAQLEQKQIEVESAQSQLNEVMQSLQAVTEEVNALRANGPTVERIIASKNEEIENLQISMNLIQRQTAFEMEEVDRMLDMMFITRDVNRAERISHLSRQIVNMTQEVDRLRTDNEQLAADREVYKNRATEFENELGNINSDSNRIVELENRIARIISERDLLQLQLNDVTRSFEDYKESTANFTKLQEDLETVMQERNHLLAEIEILQEKLILASSVQQTVHLEPVIDVVSAPIQESLEQAQLSEVTSASADQPRDSMWDDEEDPWAIPHSTEEHIDIPVVPSTEIQLKLKVDELEEKLKELTEENIKLIDDSKQSQVKNMKYVKKLKEYKVQFDSLQRQLKTQSSLKGFGDDLDSAIEEELKFQVAKLEKALEEAKEETKKVLSEKENLLKRIDVLTAATERFIESKEKQDTEVHIWQMRYKEIEMKLQKVESGSENIEALPVPSQTSVHPDTTAKYEEEIKELKDSVDALAAENDELQQLLEEHRVKRQTSIDETAIQLQELHVKNDELTATNDKLKSDYDTLRKQYEQSLMDANDQVTNMRENCEILKSELIEKNEESEKTVADLNEQLRTVSEEKTQLEVKIHNLEFRLEELNSTASSLNEVSDLLNTRVQEVANLKEEIHRLRADKVQLEESTSATVDQLRNELQGHITQQEHLIAQIREKDEQITRQTAELEELRTLVDKIKGLELSIEGYIVEVEEKNAEIYTLKEKISQIENVLSEKEHQVTLQQSQLQQSATEMQQCTSQVHNQQDLTQKLNEAEHNIAELTKQLSEKESNLQLSNTELNKLQQELHNTHLDTKQKLEAVELELMNAQTETDEARKKFEVAAQEIQNAHIEIEDLKKKLDTAMLELHNAQVELEDTKKRLEVAVQEQNVNVNVHKDIESSQDTVKFVEDDIPVFTFGSDGNDQELQRLREEIKIKDSEIENLSYSLNEGSLTKIIQELQDNVNALYNEKADLEEQLAAKDREIKYLKPDTERKKRSENEQLLKLENELYEREQELRHLKHSLNEKENQLQSAMNQISNKFEQTQSVDTLRNELYEKQQELESLKFTVSELQSEIANLRGLERLAAEDRATIERLNSEKEEVRREAEETMQRILRDRELEMDELKRQLATENQGLIEALGIRERDLENLKLQIEQTGLDRDSLLEQKTDQLARLEAELSERDRRLAELSITKDTEIYNIRVQLGEKAARLEELIVMSEEEERQLAELRKLVDVKEQQIGGLTQQLEEKAKEFELMQHALQRHVGEAGQSLEVQQQLQQQSSSGESSDPPANELDVALYMLHQRDVRCEELTHELMQLLEERDTLQLRLSNAIRVNEELRKYATDTGSSPKKDTVGNSNAEPLIQDPSPSKSEGPVEIAKEAINSSIGEDKKALAQKLSQLKSIHHTRDVRLRDDRELRHTQQMTLLAHKDALNTLPPEAQARLVNANYTVSRDVQSQSSTLLNWLWGKSTPKIVHM